MIHHEIVPFWVAQDYLFLFGLVTLLGGIMGFVKARSTASLVAGGVCGLLLLVAGALLWGHLGASGILALIVSLALLGRFGPALTRGNRMPAAYMVPLAALGVVVSVFLLVARWG